MALSASVFSASMMRVVGAAAVVLGGMIAAVTGPLELTKGSWVAAYLVLVAGVAQIVMGSARQYWPRDRPGAYGWTQFAFWNLGNIAVVVGTVVGATLAVLIGSALLVVALVLAFLMTFRLERRPRWILLSVYRVLLVLLAVSIPVGVTLSAIRNA